jgi:hypothetical protein
MLARRARSTTPGGRADSWRRRAAGTRRASVGVHNVPVRAHVVASRPAGGRRGAIASRAPIRLDGETVATARLAGDRRTGLSAARGLPHALSAVLPHASRGDDFVGRADGICVVRRRRAIVGPARCAPAIHRTHDGRSGVGGRRNDGVNLGGRRIYLYARLFGPASDGRRQQNHGRERDPIAAHMFLFLRTLPPHSPDTHPTTDARSVPMPSSSARALPSLILGGARGLRARTRSRRLSGSGACTDRPRAPCCC